MATENEEVSKKKLTLYGYLLLSQKSKLHAMIISRKHIPDIPGRAAGILYYYLFSKISVTAKNRTSLN